MARPAHQPVQIPGAAPQALPVDDIDADDEPVTLSAEERIAQLEARLAAQTAETARLQAEVAAPKLPQVVYEPETPHGKANLEASATAGMTVAQVMQAIKDGRLAQPITSYLCADGYYAKA